MSEYGKTCIFKEIFCCFSNKGFLTFILSEKKCICSLRQLYEMLKTVYFNEICPGQWSNFLNVYYNMCVRFGTCVLYNAYLYSNGCYLE